ncbi:13615_t:CDS:2 [Funneliformis geosporum]|uniref:11501_t:CDS:1 n=1 Tax=Funneliformis geosporum TaxID=1117311 RepID=A0A9W4WQL1_9GLOM|nr:13615_t:CDS:2 [Funneliformis geosporum]CAI2171519.1 11501_t:CDS:2 [Funneliformis geosporum]
MKINTIISTLKTFLSIVLGGPSTPSHFLLAVAYEVPCGNTCIVRSFGTTVLSSKELITGMVSTSPAKSMNTLQEYKDQNQALARRLEEVQMS